MTSAVVTPTEGVVGRRLVAGDERFGAAGVAALEPLGHDAGPGGHVADRLGGRDRVRRRHVGDGRFDRAGPGPGIEPGRRQLRAVRETSRAMKPSQTTGIARRSSSGRRRGSGWSIGLERSWERARAVILELDGRLPAAENRKATAPPATGRQARPARSDTGPTHNQGQDRGAGQARCVVRGRDRRSPPADGSIVHAEARGHRPSRRCRAGGHGRGSSRRWTVGTLGHGIVGRAGPGPIS